MSKKTGRANLRKRCLLFADQGGLCVHCGEPMVLMVFSGRQKNMPANAATLEHLESRLHPDRGAYPGHRRVVLAHSVCNNEYNRRTEIEVGVEELRRRAGHGHLNGRDQNEQA